MCYFRASKEKRINEIHANILIDPKLRNIPCAQSGQPTPIVVVDVSRLKHNLHLVLQILEITDRVVCLNLMDEARRKHLEIDERHLAHRLSVPVVATVARYHEGREELWR